MRKIELLAPAGSMESLYAAVNAGCDAVYLGGSKFSARAYASNFDNENIKEAVFYCHINGVKIYVTINTLLRDDEVLEALDYVGFLESIGVDGVIVQDVGLAYLIRKNYKTIELHASTQMSIHNGDGAKALIENGFKRIVVARECSLEDIEYISKTLGIETEMFVHGALCISYSGKCLMSSMIGGRSGNRGRCAQSCRQKYTLIDEVSGKEKDGYLLSPKDLAFIENIGEIIETGTASLKIEGRMKKPEYVAGVVSLYRKAIDCYYNNEEFDYDLAMKELAKFFNREGFSKGYLFKNLGSDMMSYKFPKNTGVYIGTAVAKNRIRLEDDLVIGDGIRNDTDGFVVQKLFIKKEEVESAGANDEVTVAKPIFKPGDKIYKTLDTNLLKKYKEFYSEKYIRKNDMDLNVEFVVGESLHIYTNYNGKFYETFGDEVQKAVNRPMDKERITEKLAKSGNTAFKIKAVIFERFEDGFLPVSAINEARRTLIELIEEDYKKEADYNTNPDLNRESSNEVRLPKVIVSVQNKAQFDAALEMGQFDIAINPFMRRAGFKIDDITNMESVNLYLHIPVIVKEEWDTVCKYIDKVKDKLRGILTSNIGVMAKYKKELTIISDYKSNAFNKYSLDFLSSVCDGLTMSVELNKGQIKDLIKSPCITPYLYIYGKVESMVSEYCPIGSVMDGKNAQNDCKISCEKGEYVLRDRLKEDFRVKTDIFCRSHIYNSRAINIIDNLKEIKSMNINNYRIEFIDESYDDVKRVINSFNTGEKLEGQYTRGHFKRGVE